MEGNPRHAIRTSFTSKDYASVPFRHNLVKDADGKLLTNLDNRFNDLYKSNVFSNFVLEKMVPKAVLKQLKKAIAEGKQVDPSTADVVAQALKEWAVEKGCTHYTHWFQPIRFATAEKHDSFVDFFGHDRDLRYEFTGEQLLRAEPDASSFPGGGLRSTYQARGYTAWDPSSPPFIIEGPSGNTLLIPTMYISWTGEALDYKTPLIRSVGALNRAATKLLHLLGDKDVTSVHTTLGAEQEFFVIDRSYYNARPDLYSMGRTVLGAKPAKGQEKSDHYFGAIPERVLGLIQEVEEELWKLGVPTKTRHNEVAPSQHEMAPIFEDSNLASDHNLLTMQLLQKVAQKHNLVVLLHEKPFAGVNGSGKHNNWSMCTDTGINLLNPTDKPLLNTRFLVFLAATIKAVDIHADILRAAVATPGNDHRLGANEAPPAIMSVYLGDELAKVVEALIQDHASKIERPKEKSAGPGLQLAHSTLELGVGMRPLKRDRTDRNRTSPFAFTGNKFEFRAPGSSQHVSHTCFILNVIAADAVSQVHDEIAAKLSALKKEDASLSDKAALSEAVSFVVGDTLTKHHRVVFNGNGYSKEWVEEAERRGLPHNRDSVSALAAWSNEKNVALFAKHNVLSKTETLARANIFYDDWSDTITIEAKVVAELADTHVLPAAIKHQTTLAGALAAVKAVLGAQAGVGAQEENLKSVSSLINSLIADNTQLKKILTKASGGGHDESDFETAEARAVFLRDEVLPRQHKVRELSDQLEKIVDDNLWVLPKYQEILTLK